MRAMASMSAAAEGSEFRLSKIEAKEKAFGSGDDVGECVFEERVERCGRGPLLRPGREVGRCMSGGELTRMGAEGEED